MPEDERSSLGQRLSSLAHAYGPAREWDVFLENTLAPLSEGVGGEACLTALRTAAIGRRDRAAGTIRQVTTTANFMALSLELGCWFGRVKFADLFFDLFIVGGFDFILRIAR